MASRFDGHLGCPHANCIAGYVLPQGCPVAASLLFSGASTRMGLLGPGVVHPESLDFSGCSSGPKTSYFLLILVVLGPRRGRFSQVMHTSPGSFFSKEALFQSSGMQAPCCPDAALSHFQAAQKWSVSWPHYPSSAKR